MKDVKMMVEMFIKQYQKFLQNWSCNISEIGSAKIAKLKPPFCEIETAFLRNYYHRVRNCPKNTERVFFYKYVCRRRRHYDIWGVGDMKQNT